MTRSEKLWDNIAEKYAAKPVNNPEAYEETLERVRHHLKKTDNVLEFGCGTGSTALVLAKNVEQMTALDKSTEMTRIAQEKASKTGVRNVTVIKGTLQEANLAEESFDAVMGFHILHLVEDLPSTIKQVSKLLKPGGMFITKTTCVGEMPIFIRPIIALMQFFGKAPHIDYLKFYQLEDAIIQERFVISETGLYPKKSVSRFIVAYKTLNPRAL